MKDPAFLFYSSDFIVGTLYMTDEQVGKYIKLLCMQHQKGHLKPVIMDSICDKEDTEILEKFKKDIEGNYYNQRLDKEMKRRITYTENRLNNFKKKKTSHVADHVADHVEDRMDSHSETETEAETITEDITEITNEIKEKEKLIERDNVKDLKNLNTPSKKLKKPPKEKTEEQKEHEADVTKSFDTFWDLYPRKVSKEYAQKTFIKHTDKTKCDVILAGLKQSLELDIRFKKEVRYIPHASTWLNSKGWNDEFTDDPEEEQNYFLKRTKELIQEQPGILTIEKGESHE